MLSSYSSFDCKRGMGGAMRCLGLSGFLVSLLIEIWRHTLKQCFHIAYRKSYKWFFYFFLQLALVFGFLFNWSILQGSTKLINILLICNFMTLHLQLHTYIIGYYNLSVRIIDRAWQVTYVVCVNFIHKRQHLQF